MFTPFVTMLFSPRSGISERRNGPVAIRLPSRVAAAAIRLRSSSRWRLLALSQSSRRPFGSQMMQ